MTPRARVLAVSLAIGVLIGAPALMGATLPLCAEQPQHCPDATIITCNCAGHLVSPATAPGTVPTTSRGAGWTADSQMLPSNRPVPVLAGVSSTIVAPSPPGFPNLDRHILFSVLLI